MLMRFVTTREPAVSCGAIQLGKTRLAFDSALTPRISTVTHYLHGYKGDTIPVYCIDFDLSADAKEFSIRIEAK